VIWLGFFTPKLHSCRWFVFWLGTGETLHMSQQEKSPLWIQSPEETSRIWIHGSRFSVPVPYYTQLKHTHTRTRTLGNLHCRWHGMCFFIYFLLIYIYNRYADIMLSLCYFFTFFVAPFCVTSLPISWYLSYSCHDIFKKRRERWSNVGGNFLLKHEHYLQIYDMHWLGSKYE